MPLIHSKSPEAFKTNVRTLMHDVGKSPHVKSRAQALAIAYSEKNRAGKAEGGPVQEPRPSAYGTTIPKFMMRYDKNAGGQKMRSDMAEAERISDAVPRGRASGGVTPPFGTRMAARQLFHEGFLHSSVPGRTDKLPISVSGGSYVLPADHVAALGQGNSLAGANIVNKMFKMGPGGASAGAPRAIRTHAPHLNLRAPKPGMARGGEQEKPTPIIAAGGEIVIPAHKIVERFGDLDHGHKALDHWVLSTRKQHIKTLKGLKPPKKG